MLDQLRVKHQEHGPSDGAGPKGAERIAACWADKRKVAQVAVKADWTRYKKPAPFKRNDAILDTLPIAVIVFRVPESSRTSPTKLARWAAGCGDLGGMARERLLGILNFEEFRKLSADNW